MVFDSQQEFKAAFEAGKLARDFVAVLRFQGPAANGMPELHGLTPILGVLQNKGKQIALVTDGRMSGSSGKTLAAIHLTPEGVRAGPIARLRDGDVIRIDTTRGTMDVKVPQTEWSKREPASYDAAAHQWGTGRELFQMMRATVGTAEEGATTFSQLGTK